MKEIILVNGKKPNVTTLKEIIKSNPNAKIGFTGMGNNSILKFLKENNIENKNYLYYKGFSKNTREEKIDAITKKGFEIVAEVGTDDIEIKKEVKKEVPCFDSKYEANKVSAKFSDIISTNYSVDYVQLAQKMGGETHIRGGKLFARFYYNGGKNYYYVNCGYVF